MLQFAASAGGVQRTMIGEMSVKCTYRAGSIHDGK